ALWFGTTTNQNAAELTRLASSEITPEGERMATPRKTRRLTAAEVESIFARFAEIDPEPKGELDYVNAFTLLVAVVLSAQATDIGVNKATAELFRIAPTPAAMVALGQD